MFKAVSFVAMTSFPKTQSSAAVIQKVLIDYPLICLKDKYKKVSLLKSHPRNQIFDYLLMRSNNLPKVTLIDYLKTHTRAPKRRRRKARATEASKKTSFMTSP